MCGFDWHCHPEIGAASRDLFSGIRIGRQPALRLILGLFGACYGWS
jgi:hypothetical protein